MCKDFFVTDRKLIGLVGPHFIGNWNPGASLKVCAETGRGEVSIELVAQTHSVLARYRPLKIGFRYKRAGRP